MHKGLNPSVCRQLGGPLEKYPFGQLAGGLPYRKYGSKRGLRHEVVSVIVVLDLWS